MALPLPGRLEQDYIRQLWIIYRDYSDLAVVDEVLSDVEGGRFPAEQLRQYAGW